MKTFRLVIKNGKVTLTGQGEPAPGDMLGASESVSGREVRQFLEQKKWNVESGGLGHWPGKNKPFHVYKFI